MADKIVKEAGVSLGLPVQPNQKTMIGMKEGYPTQVLIRNHDDNTVLSGIVRYDDLSRDNEIGEFLPGMPEVLQAGIKAKTLEIKDGMLIFNNVKGITGFPKVEKFTRNMEVLVQSLKNLVPPPGYKCRICARGTIDQPVLLDGLVDRICTACIEKLNTEAREQKASYEALPMNIPRSILVAAVMTVIGAAVYGGVIVATNRMLWLVAIVIGIAIGFGTWKAAGRVGWQIQVISGLSTVVSVLLGLVFSTAYYAYQYAINEHLTINWIFFMTKIPEILMEMGEDTVFSLGGGLIGAWFATRFTSKPDMEVKIEK